MAKVNNPNSEEMLMRKCLSILGLCSAVSFCPNITAHSSGFGLPAFSQSAPSAVPKIEFVESAETVDKRTLVKQSQALLDAGKFAELDNLADQLRASRATYPNGSAKLEVFYAAFSTEQKAPEAKWQTLLKKLEQWVASQPNSVAAHVALADALTGYAWAARGSGWAYTITEKGQEGFSDRLQQAFHQLDLVHNQRALDPHWYCAMLTVALGLSYNDQSYDQLFNEAVSTFPDYTSLYFRKTVRIMPRWHGKPGDMEQFADRAAVDHGDKLYAQIVWNQNPFYHNIFKETKFSWTKTRQGFQQLMNEYHNAPDVVQRFAKLAYIADDKQTFASLVPIIDGQISSSYWSKKLQYANALDWLSGSNKGKELIAADEQGKFADAQRIASQRLQEHEGIVGKDNAELITDLLSIAQASMNKGDYAQAATVLDRASGLAKTARSGIATFQKWKLSQALAP